jgi:hypothetical protein
LTSSPPPAAAGATGGENVTVEVTASGSTVEKKQLSVDGDRSSRSPSSSTLLQLRGDGDQRRPSQAQRFTVRAEAPARGDLHL